MPHVSFRTNSRKTYRTVRRPFEKERLDQELKVSLTSLHGFMERLSYLWRDLAVLVVAVWAGPLLCAAGWLD